METLNSVLVTFQMLEFFIVTIEIDFPYCNFRLAESPFSSCKILTIIRKGEARIGPLGLGKEEFRLFVFFGAIYTDDGATGVSKISIDGVNCH